MCVAFWHRFLYRISTSLRLVRDTAAASDSRFEVTGGSPNGIDRFCSRLVTTAVRHQNAERRQVAWPEKSEDSDRHP